MSIEIIIFSVFSYTNVHALAFPFMGTLQLCSCKKEILSCTGSDFGRPTGTI